MQIPMARGRYLLALSQVLVGCSVMLSSVQLLSGLYLLAICVLRHGGSRDIGVKLAFRLVYVLAGGAGLLAFSTPMRPCQKANIWFCLVLNMACVAASSGLLLGVSFRSIEVHQLGLLVAASASLVLCVVHSASLYIVMLVRRSPSPQLPPQTPQTSQPPQPPPMPSAQQQQQQQMQMLQQQMQMEQPMDYFRRFNIPAVGPPPPYSDVDPKMGYAQSFV